MLDRQMRRRGTCVAATFVAGALLWGMSAQSARAQPLRDLPSSPDMGTSEPGRSGAADYQTLYVSSEIGHDSANGTERQPLQTVTRALEIALSNTVIVLAPGRYTRESGEVFPLQLKPGVTIQGMPGSRDRAAIIEGGGSFESPTRARQNAAVLAADGAGIAQIAISNANGYGVWVEATSPIILETALVGNRQTGIYVASGSPRIQGSYFSGNQVAGLIVSGRSNASIESNIFDATGDAIRVMEGATPEIVGNRITNNDAALIIIGDARPTLRDNQITGNRRNDVLTVAAQLEEGSAPAESVEPAEDSAKLLSSIAAPEPVTRAASSPPTSIAAISNLPVISSSGQSIPVPVSAHQPARPPTQPISQLLPVSSPPADSEALIPAAGAPGPALSALRSRLSLAPRAVSGENLSSPVLSPDDERQQPENRPEPAAAPLPESAPIRVNNNRLAVPSSSIPIGDGSSSIIFSPPAGGVGAPPAPPSRAQALGLYYRVFVETSDPYVQDDVRSVVPDAFRTNFEGRTMMQVGAFPTEDEAEARKRLLEDNNFDVRVEYIR